MSDKALHALVGALIAAAPIRVEYAVGLVVVAAVAKEIHDSRRGHKFDASDALATIAGGAPVLYLRWEW